MTKPLYKLSLLWLLGLLISPASQVMAAGKVDFQRDVRPILSAHCFKCHGPDEGARKAKLRLDKRDAALKPAKSGEIAIVPGKVKESELVTRVFSTDEDDLMPPPGAKLPLTDAQKETLKQWVKEGAEYQPHWAFIPPKQSPLPKVKDRKWPVNPIDYFVLAKLEKEKLKPAKEADRYTLIRRVYLDLIGLPPTPEQVQAFLNDKSPDAYDKVVDELLASPHYGERWARRWLDLARYADTNGYEKDRQRSIWPYRDWVINALNADMPFNEFTIEQLAGDMLPHPTTQQIVATGFHRNTMLNEEGGIDPLEFRFYSMVDRVATTGTTWLGLTLMCAQCHTHKYDPITQTEYYQIMAFMNNADEPEMDLPDPEITKKRAEEEARIAKLIAALPEKYPVGNINWLKPKPVSVQTESGEKPEVLSDGTIRFGNKSAETDTYTIELEATQSGIDRIQLDALTDPGLPKQGPGCSSGGNFVLSEFSVTAEVDGQPVEVKLKRAEADFSQTGFAIEKAIDGNPKTGWAIANPKSKTSINHKATFHFEQPLTVSGKAKLTIKLTQLFGKQHTLGKLRLSLGQPIQDSRPIAVRRQELIDKGFATWVQNQRQQVVPWQVLHPQTLKANLALLTVQPDDSVFASGDMSKSDTYELDFKIPAGVTAFRLEALPDDRLPAHGPGATFYEGPKGDFFLSEFTVQKDGQPVKFASASQDYGKPGIGNGTAVAANCIDGDPQSGWSINGGQGDRHVAVFNLEHALAAAGEAHVKILFEKHYAAPLGRFRIAVTMDHQKKAMAHNLGEDVEDLLLKDASKLTAAENHELLEAYLMNTPELAAARKEIEQAKKAMPEYPTTLVMRERPKVNPRTTHLHHRGEYLQAKEAVKPDVLEVLNPLPPNAPHNRLSFARWIVSEQNPLTARVTVNRQWAAFFGNGIVRTTGDFGFQGELPTDQPLLDWLAVEFMKEGWSLKKIHRLIVTSATYRQDSTVSKQLAELDPENRLLARGPRVRLEAELIRDSVLKAAGLLSDKLGGPSVFPPQPPGVTTEGAYGKLTWKVSEGADRYRRGLYTFCKRTTPFAMLNTFDAPSGEACVAKRDVSNTPLQALTLLNDVVFVEAAQALGKEWASKNGSTEEKLQQLFERCLVRPANTQEIARLKSFYESQLGRLQNKELDATELAGSKDGDAVIRAAWTIVARALLNLDEMVTKS